MTHTARQQVLRQHTNPLTHGCRKSLLTKSQQWQLDKVQVSDFEIEWLSLLCKTATEMRHTEDCSRKTTVSQTVFDLCLYAALHCTNRCIPISLFHESDGLSHILVSDLTVYHENYQQSDSREQLVTGLSEHQHLLLVNNRNSNQQSVYCW